MAKLHTDWAVIELDKFLAMTETYVPTGPGWVGNTRNRGSSADLGAQAYVVEAILDNLPGFAGWRSDRPSPDKLWRWLREQTARSKAALQRAEELAENLGDTAPEMDARNLHPWAWENGRSYWNNGFYDQAVLQSALRINAETQAKLGLVQPGEVKLFQLAFSLDDPKPDAPRLRLMPKDASDTFKNVHQGARALGEALFWGIRNVKMHAAPSVGGGREQLALEQLAAFSLLARWVDQAAVDRV